MDEYGLTTEGIEYYLLLIFYSFIYQGSFTLRISRNFLWIYDANCTHVCYKNKYSSEYGNLATNPKMATSENMREGAMVN